MISCGPRPERTITKTEYQYIAPPEVYTERREIPEYEGVYNEDLVEYVTELMEIIELHNIDKKNIQQWRNMWVDEVIEIEELEEEDE